MQRFGRILAALLLLLALCVPAALAKTIVVDAAHYDVEEDAGMIRWRRLRFI